jgi:hypothetical protein
MRNRVPEAVFTGEGSSDVESLDAQRTRKKGENSRLVID